MKILAVGGSPRGGKSQTHALSEALLTEARSRGAETEFIDLGRARIGFCKACEVCHRGPGCALDDDGAGILRRMLEADATVLASPVYLDSVTAQMKTLLDRSSHFIHCLRMEGKYLAAVTTSGGSGSTATIAFLRRYALSVGAQFVGSVDVRVPLRDADFDAARALGRTLVDAVAQKRNWPDQQQAIEEQRAYFGRIITLRKDHWPFEHKYWTERGWL